MSDDVLVLTGDEVASLLAGRERELIEVVERAYLAHAGGQSSLPHSVFLRFPGRESERIIALPAYLGDGFGVAGVKWIASFPGNVGRGMARASALVVLNSCDTGRPEAILEGSIVSARRTAASAAAAAGALLRGRDAGIVGLVGAGVINYEVARFLRAAVSPADRFQVFDLDSERAARFAARLETNLGVGEARVAGSVEEAVRGAPLVCFATSATRPHVHDLSAAAPGAVVLHVSLRDLAPEVILAADNVVDDVDHVCRAETSVHLAERVSGGRGFIRCTLAEVLSGAAPARRGDEAPCVFSPFGLGILDLAVAQRVRELAVAEGRGTLLRSFLPAAEEGAPF